MFCDNQVGQNNFNKSWAFPEMGGVGSQLNVTIHFKIGEHSELKYYLFIILIQLVYVEQMDELNISFMNSI